MPTRVAIDYRPALFSGAGIGRAVRELSNALVRRNDLDIRLFGHGLARAKSTVPPAARARLHRLPVPGRGLPLLASLGLPAERLAGGAAVVHWTDYVHPPAAHARVVLTVHDLAFVRDPRWHGADAANLRDRTAKALAAAAAVVVPSRTTANDVRAFAPSAPAPRVVPFGVDHAPRLALAAAAASAEAPFGGRDFVLAVGTIEPRKNHAALLAAWERLPSDKPMLVVAGRAGWECGEITAALCAAERSGDVAWLPHVDDERLFALLAHTKLLAYPSLWEGFGFPPLEAMALGVPVVAHRSAALEETAGDAALLCDANDPEAFAAALDRTLRDDSLRSRLAAAGRARAATFRWDDCAAAHAALYREVAA